MIIAVTFITLRVMGRYVTNAEVLNRRLDHKLGWRHQSPPCRRPGSIQRVVPAQAGAVNLLTHRRSGHQGQLPPSSEPTLVAG